MNNPPFGDSDCPVKYELSSPKTAPWLLPLPDGPQFSSGTRAAANFRRSAPAILQYIRDTAHEFGIQLRFNNVFDFRTSYGRVPSLGSELFLHTLSVEDPMGRSIPDVAMLLSVIAGTDPRAPFSIEQDPAIFAQSLKRDFRGTRIDWLGNFDGYLEMQPGILELWRMLM